MAVKYIYEMLDGSGMLSEFGPLFGMDRIAELLEEPEPNVSTLYETITGFPLQLALSSILGGMYTNGNRNLVC